MCGIKSRLNQIAEHLGLSMRAFEESCGLNRGNISNMLPNGNIGSDKLSKIFDAHQFINPMWLLTGKGEMLREDNAATEGKVKEPSEAPQALPIAKPVAGKRKHVGMEELLSRDHQGRLAAKGIPGAMPLVSQRAVGGIISEAFSIATDDIISYYVIPKFRHLNVDFLMELTGDSMSPRLCAGDIIACSIIHSPSFIQWNKPHLVSTREQGLIVKRLRRGSDEECLMMVSDNPEYDPFDVPKSEILGIARVVGSIHAE